MPEAERSVAGGRHRGVPAKVTLVALLAVAACGGPAVDQLRSARTPASTQPPSATAGVTATAGATATVSPQLVGSPRPSTAPATVEPTAGTTVLRDGDAGSTVRLRVGQRVRVELADGTWDPPTSSAGRVVVRRSSSGGYPTSQPVDAVFEAVAAGTADLTAQSDAVCFHTEPRCLMPTREWRVHVVVT